MDAPVPVPPHLQALVRRWGQRWGLPELPDHLSLQFSQRMTRSLGRCLPREGRVRLAAHLRDGPAELLEEVLCHEVAHVAVHQLHGDTAPPHGPSWRDLVEMAGYPARTRAPAETVPERKAASHLARRQYAHRCPVCHSVRVARRPVPAWRCADCLAAGLSGAMEISRLPVDQDPNT